ncbi:MAG: penicillin-binding protein 2 [Planctomycetes bacterium]|nr:penicillin-binding protein 2 [Planctomycetota bacterium]
MSPTRLSSLHPAWLLAPLGLVYAGVLLRLVLLSGFADAGFADNAIRRSHAQSSLEVARGRILDRSGVPLAVSQPEWRLVVDADPEQRRYSRPGNPYSVEDAARQMEAVAAAAGAGLDELVAALRDPSQTRSVIAERLSPEAASRLQPLLRAHAGAGLRLENHWRRVYPQGRNLAHAVGFTKVENAKDPEPVVRGVTGLERRFDEELAGTPGEKRSLRVTAAFGINPALGYTAPVEGADRRTTLDAALSARLRQELQRLTAEFDTDWAAGVVLDPRSGEILALAGLPDFDPNRPGAEIDEAGNIPGSATPIGWVMPPGSTMKPLLIARALEAGAISRGQTFSQEGGRWYARGAGAPPIGNARGVPSEPLDWHGAIVHSSNIAAGKIGLALGRERLRALLDDLRFGSSVAGMPFRQDRGRLGSDYHWSERQVRWTVPSVSIGHQFAITPLRLAAAHASLANGGLLFEPHLTLDDAQPPVRVYSESVAAEVRGAMIDMVADKKGLNELPFAWGGKSGTVQDERDERHYTSLFLGFAPAEEPRYLALVVADRPKGAAYYGVKVAGPAVRDLLHWALSRDGDVPPLPRLDRDSNLAIVPAQER